jgi:hypothetical protein
MGVALGDDLAHEHRVGGLGQRAAYELVGVHLGAEVDDPDLPVGLEALLPREPLDVEDGVQADGVRVRADGRADDHQSSVESRPDLEIHLFRREQRELALDDDDLVEIDDHR